VWGSFSHRIDRLSLPLPPVPLQFTVTVVTPQIDSRSV